MPELRTLTIILCLSLSIHFFFSWIFIVLFSISSACILSLLRNPNKIEIRGYKAEFYIPKNRKTKTKKILK